MSGVCEKKAVLLRSQAVANQGQGEGRSKYEGAVVNMKSRVRRVRGKKTVLLTRKSRSRKGAENRVSSCCAAAAVAGEWSMLPEDLQMEVLSRLPAEDVVRLRVVNRQWTNLLCHPRLIALWSQNRSCRSFYLLRTMFHGQPIVTHYYKHTTSTSTSTTCEFRLVPPHWRSRFSPQHSYPFLSGGGLVACKTKRCFWVGNPLTRQWVKVPPLKLLTLLCGSLALIPYVSQSDGRTYFRMWLEPYVFDSAVGIWTMSMHQTMAACSYNTLLMGGVRYALGRIRQLSALVLLRLQGDEHPGVLNLSESAWVYAWDMRHTHFDSPVLLEVGGEIGLITQVVRGEVAVFVLQRNLNDRDGDCSGWRWNKVSTLPRQVKDYDPSLVCTQGSLTFVCVQGGVAVFDSQSLTWGWVEEVKQKLPEFVGWEPDLTAVANLNTPSEEVRKSCISMKYKHGTFDPGEAGCFSGLQTLFKLGKSWEEIGRTAISFIKGADFYGEIINDDEVVENKLGFYREEEFQRFSLGAI